MFMLASLFAVFLVCSYVTLSLAGLSSGWRWRNVKQSAYWREQELRTTAAGVVYLGQASCLWDRGNWVLTLVGDPYALGYQHGRLLSEEIRCGVVASYASPIDQVPALKNKPKWLRRLALLYLDVRVYARLERHAPRQYLEELVGLADGAGLPYRSVFRANFLSDLKMVMLPSELKRQQGFSGPLGECSSVIVGGERTASGYPLFGRNTDYVGGDLWCAQQTIIYYRPSHGYSYASVTTAGMLKCNSAINEHGLTLGGHFMGFAGARAAGESFSLLEHEVMRSCREVGEAKTLLVGRKLAGSFAFALASARGEALVLEADSRGVEVRHMHDQQLIVTNCASTEAKQRTDLLTINHVMQANIQGRKLRAVTWLDSTNQPLTPAAMAKLMGDRVDACSNQERASAATIGFKDNVTSVVFDPHDRVFWVASGPAPACDNDYVAYGLTGPLPLPALKPYDWRAPKKAKALRLYMRLLVELAPLQAPTLELLSQLEAISQLDPDEPRYLLGLARLNSQLRNWPSVLQALERLSSLQLATNEVALAQLLKGLAYTELGQADLAKQELASLIKASTSASWLKINRLLQALAKRISQGATVPSSVWRLDNEILE